MLEAILLIVSGILAVPSLLLSKKPDAKATLDKITPFQGWIGVVILIWGLWSAIYLLINIGTFFGNGFVGLWILLAAIAVVESVLGFILGFNLINTYVLSKNAKSEEKGQQLLAKLLPLQGTFGIAAIILGVVAIVLLLIVF
ncbi:hypothetical protein GCM10023211_07730 [Orbus sasakiae]|uniref:Uncharacterized protein n=1 Tax=Orbus sasakiae TaxID=1078475 RepID=A0ABP9N3V1_9GAMM